MAYDSVQSFFMTQNGSIVWGLKKNIFNIKVSIVLILFMKLFGKEITKL